MKKSFRMSLLLLTALVAISISSIPGSALGGNISISTTPSGAYIYLDNQYKGVTPFIIKDALPGSHTIKLTLNQYDDWTTIIDVVEGSTTTVSAALNKTAIYVSSTPSGARIYLDNSNIGTTPFTKTQLLPGSHTIKLTLNEYDDWITTVNVVEGSTTTVSATLNKTAIYVSSTPSGARIYLDNYQIGYYTPFTITQVSPGSHTIKLYLNQYDDWITTVNVVEGSTTTVSAALNKTAIYFSSTPSGAYIFLDNYQIGTTPFTKTQVSPGSHTIKLYLNQYDDWITTVNVVEGSTTTVSATLSIKSSTQNPTPTIITPIITPTYTTPLASPAQTSTPTITPTYTSQPPAVPEISSPSEIGSSSAVLLHGEKTDVVLGEDILLKLSAVNLITKPPMSVQVMIYPPSGMSVTGSEFVKSGAGIYTTTYTLNPGDGKDIEVHIKSNQVGDFNVKGRIVYYFGEDKDKAEDHTLNLPIKVRKEAGQQATSDSTPKTPGFAGELAFIGILFVALLLKRRR